MADFRTVDNYTEGGARNTPESFTRRLLDVELIDISGQQFGLWRVIRRSAIRGSKGRLLWDCLCLCGKTKAVEGTSLRRGSSSGCLMCRTPRLPAGVANIRRVLQTYQKVAKNRGYEWALTDEHAQKLFASPCMYCGSGPSNARRDCRKPNDPPYRYNGIDRVENSIGYTEANCVSCCDVCNRMKRDLTVSEFYDHIDRILSRRVM